MRTVLNNDFIQCDMCDPRIFFYSSSSKMQTHYYKGKYFGQKHLPGGNKFNLGKNREEIQLEKTNDKLSTFLYFMDIFPVFDEFLP